MRNERFWNYSVQIFLLDCTHCERSTKINWRSNHLGLEAFTSLSPDSQCFILTFKKCSFQLSLYRLINYSEPIIWCEENTVSSLPFLIAISCRMCMGLCLANYKLTLICVQFVRHTVPYFVQLTIPAWRGRLLESCILVLTDFLHEFWLWELNYDHGL